MTMTWEQKLEAIAAIGSGVALKMRSPGDWYVEHRGVEVSVGSMLASRYGNGSTPEKAVEDHWRNLTKLAHGEYLVTNATSDKRQAWKWNGYRWATVRESNLREFGEGGQK